MPSHRPVEAAALPPRGGPVAEARARARARMTTAQRERDALVRRVQRLTDARLCQRCGREYHELDNLGTWRCRYHWGTVASYQYEVAGVSAGHWTCCRRAAVAMRPLDDVADRRWRASLDTGCTPCDHTSVAATEHEPRRRLNRPTVARLFGSEATPQSLEAPGRTFDARSGELVVDRAAVV